ncbi:MAG: phage major capsid protein [Candidatus Thorarchaeota archaeon]|jgi:hypothetical protein
MAFNENGNGNLRDLCDSAGVPAVEGKLLELIEADKFTMEQSSLKELWDGFTNHAPLSGKDRLVMNEPKNKREAVGTGAFTKITGALINKKIIEGYNSVPAIGGELTTTVPSRLQTETIPGIADTGLVELVAEGADYKSSSMVEKYVTIPNNKYGRIIDVTEELIYFDQTGQVLVRARTIGEGAAYYKEKLIVDGVQDVNTNVYRPSGAATALYSTANSNLQASNAFDAAGLQTVYKAAHDQTSDSDDTKYILVDLMGKPLLVPVDLMEEAWELAFGPEHPETAARARNYWQGKFKPMTSQFITAQSTTTWYWGDFAKDFWWMEVWPLQNLTAKAGHEDEFNKDIKAKYKTRFFGGIGAVDFRHVYKSTA